MIRTGNEWVEGYVQAWRSNDPDDIKRLFSDEARYFTSPDSEPRIGPEAIAAGWLADHDEPGSWTFEWTIVREDPDFVVVQGRTQYPAERDYLNLWIVHRDGNGRATEFTEWYMPRPHEG